ncbi:hypothetical protein AXG93_868s1090 [Marchantia polymorpha subsp. ruderalis]|uniref:Uncharacterized protein n=1 Tax=Marchantia polymorpha subsp. ruderalis TaxID=1480154 RepID=A0A176VLR6_MARPO|nr:hypothetical protein AXG93_868s1090 [Marchantia polymorpha subsp. ruderalis]
MDALVAAYESEEDDKPRTEVEKNGHQGPLLAEMRANSDQREAKRMKMMLPFDTRSSFPASSGRADITAAGFMPVAPLPPISSGIVQRNQQVRPAALPFPSGRYVSKRERAAAAALADSTACPIPSATARPPPGVKNILTSELPHHIRKKLENIDPHAADFNRLPKGLVCQLEGHIKGINAARWSPTHASLLASAGMDNLARIWNVWNASDQQMVQQLSSHTAAVKDIQWSTDGKHLLSCGFDKVARLTDVEYGSEIKVFADENVMNVVRFHPLEDGSFLAGGGKGTIKLWDIRSGKPVKEYSKSLGQILDLDFNKDGKRFVSTSDIAKRNASDRAIIVWDYNKQIALSNQVYLEAYTCPSVRYHPFEETFIAQSNASYIAIFSGRPPYKMNSHPSVVKYFASLSSATSLSRFSEI